jgi:hypothetical protein
MKTLITLTTLALLAGCATPYQPLPIAQDPTPQEACLDVSKAFTRIYESLVPLGEDCLRHAPNSTECAIFGWGLQKMMETGISEALVLCLSTGNLTKEQSVADRNIPAMDRLTPLVEKQAAREKKAGL